MRNLSRAVTGAALATLTAIALSGCDENLVADAPEVPASDAPATPDAGDQEPPDGSEAGDPGDLTDPGTTLSVGDTATVLFRDGTVALTVLSVEEGDTASFRSQFEDSDDLVPYYIQVRVENVSDEDLSYVGVQNLRAVTSDGRSTGVTLFGKMDECGSPSFPAEGGRGAVLEGCVLEAAPVGMEIGSVEYNATDGGYRDDPVVWQR